MGEFGTLYFERYARLSLLDLFPGKYHELSCVDKPDLQDAVRYYGIEVTRAMREDVASAMAMENELAGGKRQDYKLERFNSLGWGDTVQDPDAPDAAPEARRSDAQTWWLTASTLMNVINKKIDRLNSGHYARCKVYGLYVFSTDDLDLAEVRLAAERMRSLQADMPAKYSFMYINQVQALYTCDLTDCSIRMIAIGERRQKKYHYLAMNP